MQLATGDKHEDETGIGSRCLARTTQLLLYWNSATKYGTIYKCVQINGCNMRVFCTFAVFAPFTIVSELGLQVCMCVVEEG